MYLTYNIYFIAIRSVSTRVGDNWQGGDLIQ